MENYKNVSQDIRDQLNAEAEAVQIILTGIDNDSYSTVDACPNACEMLKAIERLKQGESINVQDLETNLYWEFGKFTSRDGESLESYYSRFYKMMNELVRNQCDVTNHQVNVQFLLQLQPEWQRLQQAATRNRGKAIVNSPPPIYDQEPSMVAEDDEMSKDKEIDKLMALISLSFRKIYKPTNNNLRTSSNTSTPVVQKSGIQCYNCKEYGHVARECQKPKRAKDAAYHMENMLLYAADNSGPIFGSEPLQKVPNNDNYNVFAIESEHPEQSKSVHDTYPIEKDEHNVIIDSLDTSYDREQVDQDDDDDLANERDLLASALVDKLKGEIKDFKNKTKSLESSNNHFKEANNELSKTNQLMYKDLKKFQAELDKYHDTKYASKVETDCAKAKGDLMSYKIEFEKASNEYSRKINDLNQTISEMKKELFAHQEAISIMSQQKEAHINFYKTREDKEIDKVIALENKVKVLDNIVYKLDLKAQLQDKGIAINELKKLIEKLKGKYMETKFEKSSVIRQPNAFKSQRPSILGKPTIFSDSIERKDCSKSKSVTKNNVSNDFLKSVTLQILPSNMKSILKNTNVLAPGMYKIHTETIQTRTTQLPHDFRKTNKRVSFSTGVITPTNVSRPQLKSNQMKDIVMLNNSQGKKQEVEDHRRNVKFSKNKTSVTACNDKHDMCVLHSLNGMNSRTKMHMAVPIITREPKRTVNQSVAKPLRRTVASESTNQKPRHTTRKLYASLVEIILFIVDSGCSKHMTGNLKLQTNFVEKFPASVKFGNDQIAPILGYGDLVQGTVTIKRVYYVEGLNHNLFSVGDLEVAFRKSTYYIRDLKGNDLLTSSRGTDLYSITLQNTYSPNLICLMAKATSSQAWLWHRRLSHLNFDTINLLSKIDIVIGLPKLKFIKYHLCSSCELGKAKRKSFQTKTTPRSKRQLHLLYIDLCGPMRVESINGRKYVLVIVDDYSRYTWTHFLRSKDETLKFSLISSELSKEDFMLKLE
nr:hypothetical protein [Tanacetum cinerariifolium]